RDLYVTGVQTCALPIYLNHNVAISYPLLEFFITNSPDISDDVKDGYYFLTNVVWTSKEREEELDRVARAAFGPLGALIGPLTQRSEERRVGKECRRWRG